MPALKPAPTPPTATSEDPAYRLEQRAALTAAHASRGAGRREHIESPAAALEEAKWGALQAKLHPRWPEGTPGGRGGKFMKVGQMFDWDGKDWEVVQILDGHVFAQEASGKVKAVELKEFTPEVEKIDGEDARVLDVKPSKPKFIIGGGKDSQTGKSNVTAISPYVDTASHDPSIPLPKGTKVTEEDWKRFGRLEQLHYLDVQERFGTFGAKKASGLIKEAYAQFDSKIQQIVSDGYSSQYGSSSGYSISMSMKFKQLDEGTISAADLKALRADWEKARELQAMIGDVYAWDLYNRVRSPDVTVFHGQSLSPGHWQDWLNGNKPIFSGLSMSWKFKSASGFGSHILATPMSVRHIVMNTFSAGPMIGAQKSFVTENEMSVPFQQKLDARSFEFHHSQIDGGSKNWLTQTTNAQPQGGTLLEKFRDAIGGGEPLPIPPPPAEISIAGKASYLPPPVAASEAMESLAEHLPSIQSKEYQPNELPEQIPWDNLDPEGQPEATIASESGFTPGDFMMGLKGTLYWLGPDPSDSFGLRYHKIIPTTDGSGKVTGLELTGESWNFEGGGANKYYKIKGNVQPQKEEKGGVSFNPTDWVYSDVKAAPIKKLMKAGDKFKVNGTTYELLKDPEGMKVQIKDLDTGLEGTINTNYHAVPLEPKGGAASKTLKAEKDLVLSYHGKKAVVTSVSKTGVVSIKPQGAGEKVVKLDPDADELESLYNPKHLKLSKQTNIGALQPGQHFQVGLAKQALNPARVTSNDGTWVEWHNMNTGENGKSLVKKKVRAVEDLSGEVEKTVTSPPDTATVKPPDPDKPHKPGDTVPIKSLVKGDTVLFEGKEYEITASYEEGGSGLPMAIGTSTDGTEEAQGWGTNSEGIFVKSVLPNNSLKAAKNLSAGDMVYTGHEWEIVQGDPTDGFVETKDSDGTIHYQDTGKVLPFKGPGETAKPPKPKTDGATSTKEPELIPVTLGNLDPGAKFKISSGGQSWEVVGKTPEGQVEVHPVGKPSEAIYLAQKDKVQGIASEEAGAAGPELTRTQLGNLESTAKFKFSAGGENWVVSGKLPEGTVMAHPVGKPDEDEEHSASTEVLGVTAQPIPEPTQPKTLEQATLGELKVGDTFQGSSSKNDENLWVVTSPAAPGYVNARKVGTDGTKPLVTGTPVWKVLTPEAEAKETTVPQTPLQDLLDGLPEIDEDGFKRYKSTHGPGGAWKYDQIQHMPEGTVLQDKSKKRFKVTKAGPTPVITDGVTSWQIKGSWRGRALPDEEWTKGTPVPHEMPDAESEEQAAAQAMIQRLGPNDGGTALKDLPEGTIFQMGTGGTFFKLLDAGGEAQGQTVQAAMLTDAGEPSEKQMGNAIKAAKNAVPHAVALPVGKAMPEPTLAGLGQPLVDNTEGLTMEQLPVGTIWLSNDAYKIKVNDTDLDYLNDDGTPKGAPEVFNGGFVPKTMAVPAGESDAMAGLKGEVEALEPEVKPEVTVANYESQVLFTAADGQTYKRLSTGNNMATIKDIDTGTFFQVLKETPAKKVDLHSAGQMADSLSRIGGPDGTFWTAERGESGKVTFESGQGKSVQANEDDSAIMVSGLIIAAQQAEPEPSESKLADFLATDSFGNLWGNFTVLKANTSGDVLLVDQATEQQFTVDASLSPAEVKPPPEAPKSMTEMDEGDEFENADGHPFKLVSLTADGAYAAMKDLESGKVFGGPANIAPDEVKPEPPPAPDEIDLNKTTPDQIGAFGVNKLILQLSKMGLLPKTETEINGYKSEWGSGGKYKHWKVEDLEPGQWGRDKDGHIYLVLAAKPGEPAAMLYDHTIGAPVTVAGSTRLRLTDV